MLNDVILKRSGAQVRANPNVDKVSIGCRAVEVGLRPTGVHARGGSHAHAGRSVLIGVVRIVGSIGLTSTSSDASRVGVNITHGVKSSNEFLVEAGVFVVNTRVDHGDVDALA